MQPNDNPAPGDGSPNELEEAQRKLQAALLHPTDPPSPLSIPTAPEPPSISYEAGAMLDLLETLVLRVDQVAKTSAEQFARVESTNAQMVATMELAQVMIAQMDRLQTQVTDGINRSETVTLALTKVNANLTELVAALVAPRQGG